MKSTNLTRDRFRIIKTIITVLLLLGAAFCQPAKSSMRLIFTITHEGDHLFAQLSNQPKFQLFPEGEKDFFLKVINAQITFVTNAQGRATELILHQGGDQHAKRME